MAISTAFSAKITALILIILCTETHTFASEGLEFTKTSKPEYPPNVRNDVYTIAADQRENKFQDISVIDYENVAARYKRQSGNDVTPSTNLEDVNLIHDDHSYYKSLMFKATDVSQYWIELQDVAGHSTLSDSHRTAVTAKLDFRFPFYGHLIDNVTIATGGFLYMSPFIHKFLTATQYIAPLMANFDTKSGGRTSTVIYKNVGFLYMSPFLHQWLTATQYIAPLMANFDTRIGNSSEIAYATVDQKFVVEWRDVQLQDQNGRSNEGTGSFQFQAILHRNGSIAFVYKQFPIPVANISTENHKVAVGMSDAFYFDTVTDVKTRSFQLLFLLPIPIVNISSSAHPVKIGLSDAFYFDTTAFGTKRRTIYEYHRVVLNTTYIEEGTIVLMNPEPTCNSYTDCESCVNANINFQCRWCGIIQRCSDSVDWHRQKWLNAGCVHLSGAANCSSIPTKQPSKQEKQEKGVQTGIIVVVVVIIVALFGAIGGWVYYAYTHPTSASGMWLMEHRPSQMKAKMSNMKFWKRNGTAGDKYAVESTA